MRFFLERAWPSSQAGCLSVYHDEQKKKERMDDDEAKSVPLTWWRFFNLFFEIKFCFS